MTINVEDIKKLREQTGAGVMEVKKALEDNAGDYQKALTELRGRVSAKAEKKAGRETKDGLIASYIHLGGKAGSLVWLACETDFVAKTDDFKKLAQEIALQVCTEDFTDIAALTDSEYARDASKKISDLINEVIAKVGEKIEIKDFKKFDVRS